MSAAVGELYELVVRGPVGPVLERVLQPCTVQRAEVETVLRVALTATSVADLVRWFDERGWVVSRVALLE